MKRSLLSVSLRALILLVTLTAIGLGVGRIVYYERYARHQQGQQYFESMGVQVVSGDPCPPEFVYYVNGTGRNFGLQHTETPDLLDRLAGRRLSHAPIRELSFRGDFQKHRRFTREIADKLPQLAPNLESIELPFGGKAADEVDVDVVNTTIGNLSKLKELRHVSLYHWPVTDQHIESLASLPHLQVLTIYSPHLSDASFSSILKMKELRFLGINSPAVSRDACDAFHRARPEVFTRVNGTNYGSREGIYRFK